MENETHAAIAQIELKKSKYKPIHVDRATPPILDLGHLAIFDMDSVSETHSGNALEIYLTSRVRDSTQMLFNAIFSQDPISQNDGMYVQLPLPKTQVPREKPLPVVGGRTRWEQFASEKGIVNRKRSRMAFDEQSQTYKPRFGYKSAKNDASSDWLVPVKQTSDPYADVYADARVAKQARIAKNEAHHDRNLQRTTHSVRKHQLEKALLHTKKATASVGKFDRPLKGDVRMNMQTKRQFHPVTGDSTTEKAASVNVADRVLAKTHRSAGHTIKAHRAVGMIEQHTQRARQGHGANKPQKRPHKPKSRK